eukprot:gene23214-177_t
MEYVIGHSIAGEKKQEKRHSHLSKPPSGRGRGLAMLNGVALSPSKYPSVICNPLSPPLSLGVRAGGKRNSKRGNCRPSPCR